MTSKVKRKESVIYVFSVVYLGDDGEKIIKSKKVNIKHNLIYKGDICQNYFIPYNVMNKRFNALNSYSMDLKIFFELENIKPI